MEIKQISNEAKVDFLDHLILYTYRHTYTDCKFKFNFRSKITKPEIMNK